MSFITSLPFLIGVAVGWVLMPTLLGWVRGLIGNKG